MFVVGGESLIDLVPDASGVRTALPGGSPFNCAIALSKLGNDVGFLCPISQDEFGDVLMKPLTEAGVTTLLKDRVAAPTTKAIVSFNEKMQASYVFERGADRAFTRERLLEALPGHLALYQIGGFCPILPEDAAVWVDVVNAALGSGAVVSFDINVREKLIDDAAGYRERLGRFLDLAHIIKLSDEDHQWLQPGRTIEDHASELLTRPNCEMVVVTLGEHGSRAFTAGAEATASIYAPPVFVDTVGAGDSLMAGIITWLQDNDHLHPTGLPLIRDADLSSMLRFGAVVAGINCGRKGCQPPTRAEVSAVLAV
jgi:fructokinase